MSDQPSAKAVLEMLARMHNTTASRESQAGAHASSAKHDQLAAKCRDAAKKAK